MIHSARRGRALVILANQWGVTINALAEIGVYRGHFSSVLAENFPNAKLYLVDPWRHIAELAARRGVMHRKGGTAEANQAFWDATFQMMQDRFALNDNVVLVRQTSAEAAPLISDHSLDLVYIDADHRYENVQEDIRLWLPKVRRPGILCGHDYSERRITHSMQQVKRAVDDYFGVDNITVGKDQLWAYHVR